MKTKNYIIESKGFTQGIGSTAWKNQNKKKLEEIKKALEELEKEENN